MKKELWSILLVCLMILPACAKEEPVLGEDPVKQRFTSASSIYVINAVEDMATEDYLNTVIVAEPLEPGEYTVVTSGEILTGVGPATVDLRSYGAMMEYRVLEVLKGNQALVNTEVSVSETLFKDQDGNLSEPLCAQAGAGKVVLVLHKFDNDETYYNHIPEYFLMPIADDGTLEVWPYINRTRNVWTLDDFKALFDE